jgi:uncharacterized protein (DUF1684 family)
METQAYEAELARWRAEMESNLRGEESWLSLAGLFWLDAGVSTLGGDESCDVALPASAAPASVGTLVRDGEQVTIVPTPGVALLVGGELVAPVGRALRHDMAGGPADRVQIGSLVLIVIKRGERIGIRLWDTQSERRQSFEGRQWYPAQPAYRVEARFTPYETPRTIMIPTVLGDVEESVSPGYVTFTIDGHERTLVPTLSGGRLFFIVRDTTSGSETYGPGRFLYAPQAEDGVVLLDFNRLHSPPCAFTDYATCPLPPRENHLDIAIRAGERFVGHPH